MPHGIFSSGTLSRRLGPWTWIPSIHISLETSQTNGKSKMKFGLMEFRSIRLDSMYSGVNFGIFMQKFGSNAVFPAARGSKTWPPIWEMFLLCSLQDFSFLNHSTIRMSSMYTKFQLILLTNSDKEPCFSPIFRSCRAVGPPSLVRFSSLHNEFFSSQHWIPQQLLS